ncbi:MAG: glucose-6-phosphate isomerase, partial [Roseiarcus sp.]
MTQTALSAIFSELAERRGDVLARTIGAEFAADPDRFQRFHVVLDDLLYDFSKQRIDASALALLARLADLAEVAAKRDAMFRGEIVNSTERRAALHTALRNFSGEPVLVDGRDVMPDVEAERAKMLAFAADVREGRLRGALGQPMTDVVNIGIGGSDLG